MSSFDYFQYFWLAVVTFIGLFHLAWGIHDLRKGVTRWEWMGGKYDRSEEPFYFWMLIIGRFFAVIVAGVMFWFGLQMLNGMTP